LKRTSIEEIETLLTHTGEEYRFLALLGESKEWKKSKRKYPDYKTKLTEFYTNYAPDKLSQVDITLNKFKGKEEELFKILEKKYAREIKKKSEKETVTEKEKRKRQT